MEVMEPAEGLGNQFYLRKPRRVICRPIKKSGVSVFQVSVLMSLIRDERPAIHEERLLEEGPGSSK